MNKQFGGYELIEKIGAGSFGEVYLGQNKEGKKVAIKLEKIGLKISQLLNESKIFNYLQKTNCVPTMYYFGTNQTHNILITDLLGPSLENLFDSSCRKFDVSTVLFIAVKLLEIIQCFHENNFIHRDIKPENYLVNYGNTFNKIYIIDFGLSKKYRSSKTFDHIKYNSGKSLVGTPRYASINNHRGNELSRRDDLESIGYMIIYFLNGILPWQGLKSNGPDKYIKIYNKKINIPLHELCEGPLKNELIAYMEYIRGLKFEDPPNYIYLKGIFCEAIKKFGTSPIFL